MHWPYIPRILVVHHRGPDREGLLSWLRDQGFECCAASTVTDALRVAREHFFDAIACEPELPDGDGLRLLRQMGVHRPARAVLLGYNLGRGAVRLARRAGYDACLNLDGEDLTPLAAALVAEPA